MSEAHAGTRLVGRVHARQGEKPYRTDIRSGHHELVADEGPGIGGADTGPSPFNFVAAGLASCTAITLRMYAERKGWKLSNLTVDVDYFRDDAAFRIERVLHIEGELDETQRARLADIAERTPVTLALRASATINTKLA
jgi:putative redox protein